MATEHDDPCRDRADDDEPILTLRAQDELAEDVVIHWAQLAARAGVPDDRVRGATEVALAMHRWRRANPERVRTPDWLDRREGGQEDERPETGRGRSSCHHGGGTRGELRRAWRSLAMVVAVELGIPRLVDLLARAVEWVCWVVWGRWRRRERR